MRSGGNRMSSVDRRGGLARGFTLVELLVVIGIIALLIGILLPTLNSARRQGNLVKCASNMRQLATSLLNYAAENKGSFPPNVLSGDWGVDPVSFSSAPPEAWEWYHKDRLGMYLKNSQVIASTGNLIHPALVCPETREEAVRTYAMNIWASSLAGQAIYNRSPDRRRGLNGSMNYSAVAPFRGQFWGTKTKGASDLILLAERHITTQDAGRLVTTSTIGFQGDRAGIRFTGISGYNAGGLATGANTEIDWTRHRQRKDQAKGLQAVGRANFAFGDGSVRLYAQDDLANPANGQSKFVALWSPWDRQIP